MNPRPRTCHGAPQATPLLYGSVCSGIEAVSLAWQPLGLEAAWFAEIEPFPSAVLARRYPPRCGSPPDDRLPLNGDTICKVDFRLNSDIRGRCLDAGYRHSGH